MEQNWDGMTMKQLKAEAKILYRRSCTSFSASEMRSLLNEMKRLHDYITRRVAKE